MKLFLVAISLLSLVSAFTPTSKTHQLPKVGSLVSTPYPLGLLPPSQQNTDGFYPFESTALRANKEVDDGSSGVRQLLGVRGAAQETNIWKIRLQLTKPVTWIPLLWGVMCGAAASGNYHWIWNPFDPNDRNVMLGFDVCSKRDCYDFGWTVLDGVHSNDQ